MAIPALAATFIIPVASAALGEITLRVLEFLAHRTATSYNTTMDGLQKNFNEYAATQRPDKTFKNRDNFNWSEYGNVTPSCPHKDTTDKKISDTIECSSNEKKCVDLRQNIKNVYYTFIESQGNSKEFAASGIKWLCISLIIGVASTVFSVTFIVPATIILRKKIIFIIGGSFIGAVSAALPALPRFFSFSKSLPL